MNAETQAEPTRMFKQSGGSQARRGTTPLDLAGVNFPSLGFPVPFLDVSIYQMFPGSWCKAINSSVKESLEQSSGLAAKISRLLNGVDPKPGLYDTNSRLPPVYQPLVERAQTRRLGLKNIHHHKGQQATPATAWGRDSGPGGGSLRDVK